MSLKNKTLKQNLLFTLLMGVGVLGLSSGQTAKADVEVDGGQRSYGYLEVTGKPSIMQGTDFVAHLNTTGSTTDDNGEFNLTLNQKERLPAGSYRLHYSESWIDVDVRQGEVKLVKLQKVSVKNPAKAVSVSLSNDDDGDQVGEEWDATEQRQTGRQIDCHGNLISPTAMPMLAPLIILSDANPFNYREECDNEYKTVSHPLSSAYFLVFPGEYTMTWNYSDGTSHSQSGIVVR